MKGIDLDVEVDLPDGGCYQAFIKKITEDGVLVRFHENLKPDQLIKFENVRLPAVAETCSPDYAEGDIIQVHSKPDGEVLDGWWKATVKLFKDDVCYVKYLDRVGEDLVQKDKTRHCSQLDSFKALLVKVPRRLKEICDDENVHNEFILHSGVLDVIYSHSQSALIFVCENEIILQKASGMSEEHIQTLKDEKRKTSKEEIPNYYSFNVEADLIGLMIGTGGSNIEKARQIPGIKYIYTDEKENFTVTVCGESSQAVKKARDMLELRKDFFTFPKQFAGKIIGRFDRNIEDIMHRSLAYRIVVIGDREVNDKDVLLEIIGTLEAIEKAKSLLNYQLCELKTLGKSESEQTETTHDKVTVKETDNATDDSNDMPEIEVETVVYKADINRQIGMSLGISITTDMGSSLADKSIVICDVTKDSQAAKAGIRAGDKLLSVNGISLNGAYRREVAELIKSCTKHISFVLSRESVIGTGNEYEQENPDNPGLGNKNYSSLHANFDSHQTIQQYRERAYDGQTRSRSRRGKKKRW